jgi:hypothetical protein
MAVLHDMRALLAALKAHPASDTAAGKDLYLRLGLERLWIMAPKAPQIAAFEKHRRPDARAVVDGKALNVGNDP